MSRVAPIQEIKDESLKALINTGKKVMGFESVDALIMAHCPDMLHATGDWIMNILQKGSVDPGLKRLIGYICSTSAGCKYCTAHTNYTARFYGIDEAKMKEAWTFATSDLFTEAEKAALHLAKVSNERPNAATQQDFTQLSQYFTQSEIVEITFTISMYAFLNQFNTTMDTDLEDAPKELLAKLNASG